MAQVTRHSGAPYQDGETLAGSDLETDFGNIVTQVNGNLDDSNIASGADIDASKLLDGSLGNAKLENSTITTAKMAQSAVPQGYVSLGTSTAAIGTATSWNDIDGITAATITPGAVGDYIFCDLNIGCVNNTAGDPGIVGFGFSIDAGGGPTDTGYVALSQMASDANPAIQRIHVAYAATATATTAHVIKPRSRDYLSSAQKMEGVGKTVFRVQVIPQK